MRRNVEKSYAKRDKGDYGGKRTFKSKAHKKLYVENPSNEEGKTAEESEKTHMKKLMIQEVTILPLSKRLTKQAFKQSGKEPQNDKKLSTMRMLQTLY